MTRDQVGRELVMRPGVDGNADRLARRGEEALEGEDISEAELFMALRQNGVEQLGEVRLAYLEPSGHVSVFKSEQALSGRSVLPAS